MGSLDLTGQVYGRLTVIRRAENVNGRTRWHCLCSCGNETDVATGLLRSGGTRSCGCLSKENRETPRAHLEGQRFGRLTVLRRSENRGASGRRLWVCKCDCGNTFEAEGYSLKGGSVRSCGCLAHEVRVETGKKSRGRKSSRFIDLTGQRFGRLTVIERGENSAAGATRWRCICDCGKETLTIASKLRAGLAKSCGCLGLENATKAKVTHGHANTPIYRVFRAMHNRCESETCQGFKWYGQRGIRVCDEWKGFQAFYDWAMANGYKKGLTVDRLDPDKGYSPENCELVTRAENSRRMHAAHGHKTT